MDNKWNDEKIEQLLSNAPKIRDHRSKEEVLARLKADIYLQPEKKQRKYKWIPAAVSAAALLTISILVASFMNNSSNMVMQDAESRMEMSTEPAEDSLDIKSKSMNEEEISITEDSQPEYAATLSSESYTTSVYSEDIIDGTVFHLGLAGDQAVSVPITFVIPNEKILEDFGKLQPNSLDLYKKYAHVIDEEALGFSEYHPYKGTFTAENGSIIHTLPENHGYDMAPGTSGVYIGTLMDTFYGFNEVIFKNEDGTIAEFDQEGKPKDPIKLPSGISQKNYYLTLQSDGSEYLAPDYTSYETVEEALLEMKTKNNDLYMPLIPEDVNFKVLNGKGTTIVQFEKQLDLEQMEPKKAMQMIEGMLLTAASFGEQLQFENVAQANWNGFDLTQPLPIPVGPNHKEFTLK